jgi:anti-anti-sigma factor
MHSSWKLRVSRAADAGMVVLSVAGRLGTAGAGALVEAVVQALAEGHRSLLLDLEGVDYISSAGLVALDAIAGRAHADGGALVFCGVCEPVRLVLDLGGVLPDLAIEASREAAVARLRTWQSGEGGR